MPIVLHYPKVVTGNEEYLFRVEEKTHWIIGSTLFIKVIPALQQTTEVNHTGGAFTAFSSQLFGPPHDKLCNSMIDFCTAIYYTSLIAPPPL